MARGAGDMDRRVTIEAPGEVQDAAGEPVKTWAPIPNGVVWGEKIELSGTELFRAQQTDSRVTTQWTIRHRYDVDGRMRVVDGKSVYDILSAYEGPGRRVWLVLLCSRSAN